MEASSTVTPNVFPGWQNTGRQNEGTEGPGDWCAGKHKQTRQHCIPSPRHVQKLLRASEDGKEKTSDIKDKKLEPLNSKQNHGNKMAMGQNLRSQEGTSVGLELMAELSALQVSDAEPAKRPVSESHWTKSPAQCGHKQNMGKTRGTAHLSHGEEIRGVLGWRLCSRRAARPGGSSPPAAGGEAVSTVCKGTVPSFYSGEPPEDVFYRNKEARLEGQRPDNRNTKPSSGDKPQTESKGVSGRGSERQAERPARGRRGWRPPGPVPPSLPAPVPQE